MSILSVTNEARKATLASERQSALSLHRLHVHAVMQIKGAIDGVLHKLQQGAPFNVGKDAKDFRAIVALAMQQFGNSARTVIHGEQHAAIVRGSRLAQAQLSATVPHGYTWHFTQPAASMQAQEARVYSLFDKYGDEAATAATDAIRLGVLAGHGPAVIARTIQDALGSPLANALMISRTESMRALRDATLENYRANDDVVNSWTWLAYPGCCGMCQGMSGSVHDLNEDMESHNNCECCQVPNTKSWSDILGGIGIDGSDIPDTSVDVPDGSQWFAQQSAAYQRDTLGNSKYNAYKAGDITLQDLVGTGHNAVWGASRYEKSLKELGLNASDYNDASDD